jgi:hypothetical protein
MLHTLFRFFVLSALPGLYALQVYIYPFENRNDPKLAGMALTIQEMLAKSLSERNVDVVAAQVSPARVNSTDEISVIYGDMARDSGRIVINAVLEMGINQARVEKTIVVNETESLEQNLETIVRRVGSAYEEKYFALVQVFTRPSKCSLSINKKALGTTPYESVFPVGRAFLTLRKPGYTPLNIDIRVLPGNNRMSFNLQKKKKSIWQRWYTYTFIGGWLGLAGSFYLHASYQSERSLYGSVRSGDQSDYDKHYDAAQRYLVLRNVGLCVSVSLIALSSINLKDYFLRE